MNTESKLISRFIKEHPLDALSMIEGFEPKQVALLLESLTLEESALVLSNLSPHLARRVVENVPLDFVTSVIESISLEAGKHILIQIELEDRESVLSNLSPKLADHYKQILKYSKDQVGYYIDPFFPTLVPAKSVEDSLKLIKKANLDVQFHIYVLGENRKLVGYVELRDLVLRSPDQLIGSIMKPVDQQALADMGINELVEHWDIDKSELPVLDGKGHFLGVVSRSRLNDNLDDQNTSGNSALRAGKALGDLYLIGLTGLFGSIEPSNHN